MTRHDEGMTAIVGRHTLYGPLSIGKSIRENSFVRIPWHIGNPVIKRKRAYHPNPSHTTLIHQRFDDHMGFVVSMERLEDIEAGT
ncbi:hypothetical protein [Bifidobacterium simiarum]|uniref:hypothetical protein n=1 Tax=Bifidobacterium simiarum TaxID=2045441 RepID=UPI001054EED7|nr:hypothetical protein [Bifidobacterium simiarum]MBT1165828.1 hypothetical protein [Bifidobacterium simiarum]